MGGRWCAREAASRGARGTAKGIRIRRRRQVGEKGLMKNFPRGAPAVGLPFSRSSSPARRGAGSGPGIRSSADRSKKTIGTPRRKRNAGRHARPEKGTDYRTRSYRPIAPGTDGSATYRPRAILREPNVDRCRVRRLVSQRQGNVLPRDNWSRLPLASVMFSGRSRSFRAARNLFNFPRCESWRCLYQSATNTEALRARRLSADNVAVNHQ